MAEIGLMLIGGFYVYAGFVATRGALATAFFDRAMAQNTGIETPALETLRTLWLVGGSALIMMSGLALVFLLDVSRVLFVTAAIVQGSYLHIAAPYLFARQNRLERSDQRIARIAYMIFVAATLLVLIAGRFNLLKGLGAVSTSSLVLIAIIAACAAGFGLWRSDPNPDDDL